MENLWNKILITTILIFTFSLTAFFQQAQKPLIATAEDIKADVGLVPCKDSERLEGVKKLFIKMGAAEADLVVEDFKNVQNLVVTKKGKTDEIVVIGAHYDKSADGCGAIDNWTGVVIIANIYRTIKDLTTTKTYKFVAFGKEEKGLIGSGEMAKAIPLEERVKYCAMVNLDSFGFSHPQVLDNISSKKLTALAKETAERFKMPFSTATLTLASSDSASFIKNDIPAISFHGLSNEWDAYLHSSNDKLKNVNIESVFVGYQYSLQYVVKLDSAACGSFR